MSDVGLREDSLNRSLEIVRRIEQYHSLGVRYRSTHNRFFGVGRVYGKINGGEADRNVIWGSGGWWRDGESCGPAAVDAGALVVMIVEVDGGL